MKLQALEVGVGPAILRVMLGAAAMVVLISSAGNARAQDAPATKATQPPAAAAARTTWGLSAGTTASSGSRGASLGVDLLARYRIVEVGLRAEGGPFGAPSPVPVAVGRVGAVAGIRLPIATRSWSTWSLHVLAEGGADFTWANIAPLYLGTAPPGEYRAPATVPYVGLRLGGEWRLVPRSPIGPTLGLWTYARTDTSSSRFAYHQISFDSSSSSPPRILSSTDYTLAQGGQADVGVGLRLGFEIGR